MIGINNLTRTKVNKSFLEKIAKNVLKGKKIELSIALVGPKRIKELNKKYRKKNQVTDVLTFPYDDSGEVIICLSKIKKNAKKFSLTFNKELTRVLTHGIKNLWRDNLS